MKGFTIIRKLLLSVAFLALGMLAYAQSPAEWKALKGVLNFYVVNDMGRNGYYDQKPIAELMGGMAEVTGPECVFAIGDIHHFEGVRSVQDPLWRSNFENIYSHPELMLPWHPVLGNHEYRGSTQAVLDYARVSRRWEMPARYYSKVFADKGMSVRFIMLDTTPLMEKYRENPQKYPDACKQNIGAQLDWLENELKSAKENWVVVMGHHPVYAQTSKGPEEREDMQQLLDPLLRKYHVDMYICGHIHNFQHIRKEGSDTDYVVNSAAALSRDVSTTDGTRFCSSEPGFSIITLSPNELDLHMIDKKGKVLYTVKRTQ